MEKRSPSRPAQLFPGYEATHPSHLARAEQDLCDESASEAVRRQPAFEPPQARPCRSCPGPLVWQMPGASWWEKKTQLVGLRSRCTFRQRDTQRLGSEGAVDDGGRARRVGRKSVCQQFFAIFGQSIFPETGYSFGIHSGRGLPSTYGCWMLGEVCRTFPTKIGLCEAGTLRPGTLLPCEPNSTQPERITPPCDLSPSMGCKVTRTQWQLRGPWHDHTFQGVTLQAFRDRSQDRENMYQQQWY